MVQILGVTIKEVRPMTKKEIKGEHWDEGTTVIVLDNGVKLFASMDSEGNGPGTLFGVDEKGRQFST